MSTTNTKQAFLVWITGLAGSGKTTISHQVYEIIKKHHKNTILIDGDVVRELFNNDLGYDKEDRLKNAKRISNLANFLVSQDINVICSTISLFNEIHDYNRKNCTTYFEVLINTDLNELKKRDKKGLYSKFASSKITDLPGLDFNYELPQNPDLILNNNNSEDLDININKIISLVNS